MPQVVVAALTIFGNAVVAVGAIGTAMGFGIGVGALAAGAAVVIGGVMVAKRVMSLFEVEMPTVDTDASRQTTVKSTTEPQKIIYGEALVSGPISFIGLSGTDNSDLYQTIVLAGHELTDITDIHMDDVVITDAQINNGSTAGGNVTAGTFGPKESNTICTINKYLGLASQTADPLFVSAFGNYTAAHRGDGIAYLAMKWILNDDSAETWEKFAPSNVKALVKGKPVYDPRLDTGGYGNNPTDQLFITYNATAGSYVGQGQNPALVLADYLINSTLGMGINASKIDWNSFVTAANGCDVSVVVPNSGTEKRFTCNGVLFATDSHQKNINKILSSMNGNLVYSNGKYIVHAGIYEAPTETLTEDDLIGAISIRTSLERSDRFNTIKGLFIDPAQNHKSSEFPKVQLADAVTRDNNEILEKEVQYPMTNSSYMAQRLSNKLIQLSDQQKVVTFPANLSALRITAGDRVQVSIEELSWSNKVFQCVGWTFSEEGGVNLTLREDSSTSYADPAANEYSTVTATGDITDAFRGVPSPSGLTATAGLKSIELNWVNPPKPSDFGTIYIYASRNENFSAAIKIGETNGTQFIHDASNKSLISFPSVVNVGDTYTIRTLGNTNFVAMGAPSGFSVGTVFTATATGSGTGNLWATIAPGDLRYYWVRAVKNVGTDAASRSNLEPNADPNTTVFATVGRVEWTDVAGSTGAPANNATAGAQISVDLFDADGTTVMSQADVKNSVLAQEILEVEVEAGEVLSLETGQDVDIQNLGDVAIYVSDSNQTLNTSINTVANNLSALETVVVDLTSGVSEVFVQATEPVAGVGGIPDPIPDFSRWYDSSANNQPYYWSGTDWEDLRDGQTTQNAAAITNLQTSLTTTNSNVTTNASAITALDVTTVAQGNSITSITSDVTALETTVNDASTGVAATSTALGNLTTRVTTAEGSITTNSSDIVTLNSELTTAEGGITANSSAISGLDTRVTTAEGSIVSQASDITALETTVNNGTTGVAANASGLTALTTRVTNTEGATTVNAGAVTTLNATYTEDLHFRTQAEDESDNLIDLETSGTVELQDLTDFVAGSSAAIDSLTVQTFANENGIQTQAIQLTALESTVNDPTNGVVATAGALSSLSTTVSVIDGQVTSTAQDLTTLTTTVGENTSSITTQATSIDGVEANYSVKIDNNNRITGFGLLSTTSGATPFSEFAVVADQFSIVSPDSTADTPIQPFTVTADKIYFGADVIVSGDLISTGTISADRLQIDGVMFDTETVGGVTSLIIKESGINTSQIAESAITTARLSNDAVTVDKFANTLQSTNYVADTSGWQILTSGDVEFQSAKITGEINATSGTLSSSIAIGNGDSIFKADSNGIYLGNATFSSAPFRVTPAGALTASSGTIGGINIDSTKIYTGAGNFNNSDTGFYLSSAGGFSLKDKLIFDGTDLTINGGGTFTGNLSASGGTFTGALSGGTISIGTGNDIFKADSDGIYLGNATFASAPFRVTPAGALTATSVNVTGTVDASDGFTFDGLTVSGTLAAANIDVSGVITSGSLVTDSATIANDIRIGSGESVFSADSNGIYLGNETFANAEFRVSPAGALTASSATLTGNVTASSFTLSQGATLTDLDGAVSNAQQIMSEVTGVIDANQHAIPSFWRITTDDALEPSNTEFNAVAGRLPKVNDLVITTDTTVTDPVTPDRTYGWTCTVAGVADPATEATWTAITNFMSGDLLVDGSVSADQINANSVASAIITAGSIVVENDLSDGTTIISGSNILTGTIIADYIDVSGVIQAGALITDTATINNDIRIGSGESVFSADSNGIYLGNETFANAEFRVTPAGVLTATGADITGAITATSGSFTGAVSVGTTGAFSGGTSSAFNTGKGFFLGYDTDAYKLSIGDAATGKSLTWDGDKLTVAANAVSFTTGGEPTYNSNSKVPVAVRSSVLDLTSNTDYVFFANDFDQNLTLYASFYAGPLTSGVVSGLTNAQNAIMSQLSLQIQYAANVGGSPGTWTNFGSAALSSKKFTAGQLNSNYYVKTTDLGGGNYRADLATASQAATDFTGLGHSDFAYGITDEDYYMTEQVTVYGFPKGEYFIRIVVAVTDGTYSPYPATGSPALTNPRRLSINNALTYTDSDHGLSSVAKGNPQTYFTKLFNNTLIDGGSLTIAVNEENPTSNRYGGIFIGGRGETTDPNSIQPLGGIYFYNGVDDLGSGAGDIGSPNHGLFVPKTGDSLNIEAAGNGIKFNGGYGSTGATIDTNGNISTDGKIITNDLDITAPASSDAVLKFIEDGSSYPSWKIRADVGSDSVMYFNQYNGSNTATGTIAFTSTGGILATGAGSYGNGFANGGVSISSDGNYQGAGNINITGTLTQGSDARLKTDVETIDGSKVFDMRGVSFTKAGKKGAGVIAQELQEIAPELVHENEDGVLSVAYGDIVGYLIEAIKTLKQEIESIKADD